MGISRVFGPSPKFEIQRIVALEEANQAITENPISAVIFYLEPTLRGSIRPFLADAFYWLFCFILDLLRGIRWERERGKSSIGWTNRNGGLTSARVESGGDRGWGSYKRDRQVHMETRYGATRGRVSLPDEDPSSQIVMIWTEDELHHPVLFFYF